MLQPQPWRRSGAIRRNAVIYHGASPPISTSPEITTCIIHSLELLLLITVFERTQYEKETVSLPGTGPSCHPRPPLQHPYRTGVSGLDQALYLISPKAPSAGDGRDRGLCLSHPSCCRSQRRRKHSEPGPQRAGIRIQSGVGVSIG
jgi:hypothetical protein